MVISTTGVVSLLAGAGAVSGRVVTGVNWISAGAWGWGATGALGWAATAAWGCGSMGAGRGALSGLGGAWRCRSVGVMGGCNLETLELGSGFVGGGMW